MAHGAHHLEEAAAAVLTFKSVMLNTRYSKYNLYFFINKELLSNEVHYFGNIT